LDAEARLSGKTLYVLCLLEGLAGQELTPDSQALDKLEGAMLSATRVALSADAPIDFLVLKARDPRLGVTMSLVRYLPDIKSLMYMRIPRSDFENRLVVETNASPEADAPETWRDISMTEFLARLVASRLDRQLSSNPLMEALLNIRRLQGTFEEGTLVVHVELMEDAGGTTILSADVLKNALETVASDVIRKYKAEDVVRRVALKDGLGRPLLEMDTEDLLDQKAPAKKRTS
jgi:hypothetical protein